MDLLDKDFKSIVFNMLKELKETINTELKEIRRIMSYQIENIDKEREITTGIKKKIQELKMYNNWNENFTKGIQQQAEERISRLKEGQLR